MIRILVEVAVILLLILLNGFLAMSELAIVSARKSRLQHMAVAGNTNAQVALDLGREPTRFLSTVQIGITMVGILAGAFGGATLAMVFDDYLEHVPGMAPYSEAVSIGSVVIVITFLSLIFGELVPKRIALNAPERIATLVAPLMRFISALTAPVITFLATITEAILRVLRIKESSESAVTEEEIVSLFQEGTQTGVFEEEEHEMLKRLLRFSDRPINSLMTPRTVIEFLDVEDSIDRKPDKNPDCPACHLPCL